jgi:hypothetical protein
MDGTILTEVIVGGGAALAAAGTVVWRMSSGFSKLENGLAFLSKSVNSRFNKNDADHDEIFGKLRQSGEDIAVLKSRAKRSNADISDLESREREE